MALLAYITLERGLHARDRLAALLWPDVEPDRARVSLRTTLKYLRDALGPAASAISARRDAIGINLGISPAVSVDVLDLEAAANKSPVDRPVLEASIAGHRGEFLAEFGLIDAPGFDDWVTERRAWVSGLLERALDRLSLVQLESGDVEEAIESARRWTSVEPFSEPARRRLMTARSAGGDLGRAIEAFEGFRALLEGELGVSPSRETRQLAERLRTVSVPATVQLDRERWVDGEATAPPGREREWDLLEAAWSEGGMIAVSGEPGVGKSLLTTRFLRGRAAVSVIVGRPGDGGAPFASVARALREMIDDIRVPGWAQRELGRLLPEWGGDVEAPLRSGEERLRLFEAIALGLLPGHGASLAVDDAQFLDDASADLVAYVAHRLASNGGRVLLVFRRNELPRALRAPFERALEAGHGHLVNLDGLDEEGMESLIRSARPDLAATAGLAGRLVRASGGNPLLALELIRTIRDDDASSPSAVFATTPRVEAIIGHRFDRVGEGPLRLAWLAAVAGEDFDLDLARTVLSLDSVELAGHLATLEEAGVLRGLRFAHDLLGEVALRRAPRGVRAALHEGVLGALEVRGAPPGTLVRHAVAAGARPAIVRHSAAAGDAALAVWEMGEAVEHYRRALEVLRASPTRASASDGRRLELRLLEGLSRSLPHVGGAAELPAVLGEMHTVASAAGEVEIECRALAGLAYLAQREGDFATSDARCREALAVATRVGGGALIEAQVASYWHCFAAFDESGAREHLRRALEVARALGDRRRLAEVLRLASQEETADASAHTGEALALEARAEFDAAGDPAGECEALGWASWCAALDGRPFDALRQARDAVALAAAIHHPIRAAEALQVVALASLETGALGEATRAAEQALSITRADEGHLRHHRGLLIAARVAYQTGDIAAARAFASQLVRLVSGRSYLEPASRVLLCAVAGLDGDRERALEQAVTATKVILTRFPSHAVPAWAQVATLVEAEELELARGVVDRLERFAGNPRVRLVWLRSSAALERALGSPDRGVGRLREALSAARGMGLAGEVWEIEAEAASALDEVGDAETASSIRAGARAEIDVLASSIEDVAARERFLTYALGRLG